MRGRIGVIGHFAFGEGLCDGQTVKTTNLASLLERYGEPLVKRVDTYRNKKGVLQKIKLFIDTCLCFVLCKHIFLMVSVNGMRFYLPFLFYVNKIFRKNIYHYVIGSELLGLVEENARFVRYLNSFAVNWFEYESGTRYLQSQGVKNAVTLVNFKMLEPVSAASKYCHNGVYRFCTFSRVMEEKGITDAVMAIRDINRESGQLVATLDIYGPVEPEYEETFNRLLSENGDAVSYRGVADSSRSVSILKDYYALLFPTRWAGEGVAGTMVDAFAAGLPVIASDWNANGELIEHMKQGILYPCDKMQTLKDAIEWSVQNPYEMECMRTASRAAYDRYTPDEVYRTISAEMTRREKMGA